MLEDVTVITRDDPHWPPLLQEIPDPPAKLYVRGHATALTSTNMLAVVGSRRGNHYGERAIELLLEPSVAAGLTLVSGMAYGIDSMAHRLSVSRRRPTVAVLGSGIDDRSLYPPYHRQLAHDICASGGAVIAEYPPGTPAHPGRFPERNRIIAGLAQAVLVVQAAARSGSLITARLALDAGREVWAVPGAVTDTLSTGTNKLIQQGAMPILQPQDILEFFHLSQPAGAPSAAPALSTEQQAVINHLRTDPRHVDELAAELSLPAQHISAVLLELELADAVQHVGGLRYIAKQSLVAASPH